MELKNISLNKKNLHNKKGDTVIIFMIMILIFFVSVSIIGLDLYGMYSRNIKVKATINRAVKGAAMQVDTQATDEYGNNLSAKGVFLIDETEARKIFEDIISVNLGIDKTTLEPLKNSILRHKPEVVEFEILNDYKKMPYEYTSITLNEKFLIKHPTVFVVLKFKVDSFFLKDQYAVGKMSSSQLINSAD